MCGASAERKVQAKARYEYLKARGRCVECAQPAFAGRTLCAECLYKLSLRNISRTLTDEQKLKQRDAVQRRYEALKAAGMCVQCGKKPAANGRIRCPACLLNNRLAVQESKRRKHAEEPEKTTRNYTPPPAHSPEASHAWRQDNRIAFGRYV